MRQQLGLSADAPFVFVPHLLPAVRGILSTMHVGFARPTDADELAGLYADAYGASPLVDVWPAGTLPDLNAVVGTPRAAVGYTLLGDGRRAVVVLRHRQPSQGRRVAGRAELQSSLRPR